MGANKYKGKIFSKNPTNKMYYKKHLGGGVDQWRRRGEYQLHLAQHFGLKSDCSLLDFGCGPIRAGMFFIQFLKEGRYHGIETNEVLLNLATEISKRLRACHQKRPQFTSTLEGDRVFDFSILFSVLNHCSELEREVALTNTLNVSRQIIITHAGWANRNVLFRHSLRKLWVLPENLHPEKWGWEDSESIFPILVRED